MRSKSTVSFLFLAFALAAAARAQGARPTYVRGEIGPAVEVLWLEARVGRTLGASPFALDAGVGAWEGGVALTGGLEVSTRRDARVSVFARLDLGVLMESGRENYGLVNLGGGLAFRLNPAWSVRLGVSRSLPLGESILGPDRAYVGMEYRF